MLKQTIPLVLAILNTFPIGVSAEVKMFKEAPFDFYKVSKGDTFWFIAKGMGWIIEN